MGRTGRKGATKQIKEGSSDVYRPNTDRRRCDIMYEYCAEIGNRE
jgi:hypothetical protein